MLSEAAYKKRLKTTKLWKKAHPNYEKEYYKNNKTKRLADQKKYRDNNIELINECRKKRYYERLDIIREQKRKYYNDNKEAVLARLKLRRQDTEIKARRKIYKDKYYKKNKEILTKKQKQYNSRPEVKARRNANKVAKRLSDPHYRLRLNISSGVRIRLKSRGRKKDASIDRILPFKIKDLIIRLESMFVEGMTWENYGKWHLDHIIPDISFNYASVHDKEFKKAWAMENLQPLWAEENMRKGSRS